MSEPIFQLTRTSQAPTDFRLVVTSTGQTISLAPNETTIVGPEVKAAIDGDDSLKQHFTCAAIPAPESQRPASRTRTEPPSDN